MPTIMSDEMATIRHPTMKAEKQQKLTPSNFVQFECTKNNQSSNQSAINPIPINEFNKVL